MWLVESEDAGRSSFQFVDVPFRATGLLVINEAYTRHMLFLRNSCACGFVRASTVVRTGMRQENYDPVIQTSMQQFDPRVELGIGLLDDGNPRR